MKKLLLSLSLAVAAMFSAAAADQYVKVTDASTLKAGDEIIIVNTSKSVALGAQNTGNYRDKVDVSIAEDAIALDSESAVTVITLEESGNTDFPWLFSTSDGYLYSPVTNKNQCNVTSTATTTGTNIKVEITNGIAKVTCNQTTKTTLSYNTSSPRFAFYGAVQTGGDLTIFAKAGEVSVDPIEFDKLPAELTLMAGDVKVLSSVLPESIIFVSDNEEVVTVTDEGVVTAVGAGTATISAMWEADKVYAEGEAEIVVTVTEYTQPLTVTFDFENNYEAYGLEPSSTNNIEREATVEVNGITLNLTGKWVLWSNDKTLRCYKADTNNAAATMEFVAPANYNIVKIDGNTSLAGFNYNGTACEADWEGKAANVELETTSNTNFKNITVTLEKIEGASGVDAIEVDAANGAVEYFNLQGVRVDAPAAGLYIMRQGDKVSKVVIR